MNADVGKLDIADYVHSTDITSKLAFETARLCLIDTIGCGLEGLRFKECARLMGPVVEGTIVPNGDLNFFHALVTLFKVLNRKVQRFLGRITSSIPFGVPSILVP